MMSEKIKLPRSSYEELVKIIKAYSRQTKPASLSEITKITGLNETKISANVSFLSNSSVIEGAQSKKATDLGSELGRSLEHGIQEEIERSWQKVISQNDFLSKMVTAISIRNGMEVASFESHIAYSAGEAKTNSVATGARAVIDIFKASGLVAQDGDRIIPVKKSYQIVGNEDIVDKDAFEDSTKITVKATPVAITHVNNPNVTINIQVQVQASVNELDTLTEKITKLISQLNGVPDNTSEAE